MRLAFVTDRSPSPVWCMTTGCGLSRRQRFLKGTRLSGIRHLWGVALPEKGVTVKTLIDLHPQPLPCDLTDRLRTFNDQRGRCRQRPRLDVLTLRGWVGSPVTGIYSFSLHRLAFQSLLCIAAWSPCFCTLPSSCFFYPASAGSGCPGARHPTTISVLRPHCDNSRFVQ